MPKTAHKVVVIGHRNPDPDSICSAIAYAELKNKTSDLVCEARRAGKMNQETEFVLKKFGVKPPRMCTDVNPKIRDVDYREMPGIPGTTSLRKAWEIMRDKQIDTLPVTSPDNELEGVITVKDIATDPAVARRVFASFGKKLGAETEYLVSRDFLSGQEDKELLLLRFLHLAFALGPGTVKREGHPVVAPLYAMKKSLDWEVDKFQGFVRFEEHDGMLGAVIHPKNYILPLLRPHFCGRFPEEDFMIYDAVHQAVLLHEGHSTRLLELAAPLELPPPSAREQQFQALWTQFYKTLEIKARHNEKGRMTHCPKRFWADMVELQGEL